LLQAETVQLTDAVVQRLKKNKATAEIADLFGFENEKTEMSNTSRCKTYPGDARWPTDQEWDTFDSLLGRSLVPTVPIAAPCYDTQWGPKDLEKCNAVVNGFTKADTQYVSFQSGWHWLLTPA
jgi:hypothetical protein